MTCLLISLIKGLYVMSDGSSDPDDGTSKRNPPSWMSSKEKESKPRKKKQDDAGEHASSHARGRNSAQLISQFSKLLVVTTNGLNLRGLLLLFFFFLNVIIIFGV